MALTLTNDILKFRESTSDPWEKLLIQANINFNLIYPVGSIYMSTVNVDPGTIFGGTWERLKDRFLLGAGDTYTAGDTGGEAEHTLTVDEMPSHTHGSKSLVGTMNPLSWASSASESGIVSAVQQHVDRVGNSGSNWGDRLYTIDATHEHTSVGGDQAHNNMPPYLVVYMWRRLTLSPTVYTPPANVLIGDVASEDIVPVSKGGTGANNAEDAIANLGFDSSTGYCKMPDGTLIQWASAAVNSGAYVGTVNFAVEFVNTEYRIGLAPLEGSTNWNVSTKYTGGFTIGRTPNTSHNYCDWIAIGRWK